MLFSWWLNGSDSAVFRNNDFGEIKDDNLKKTFFQKKIGYWSFRYVSTLCKKVFSRAQVKCFCLYGSVSQILFFFQECGFWRGQRSHFENDSFSKKNFNASFEIVFTLCEKVFSRAPEKRFSLYGLNNSDSLVFGNATFGEIKNHSLRTRRFQKIFAMNVLGILNKKAFSRAPVKCFSIYGSNNSDFF